MNKKLISLFFLASALVLAVLASNASAKVNVDRQGRVNKSENASQSGQENRNKKVEEEEESDAIEEFQKRVQADNAASNKKVKIDVVGDEPQLLIVDEEATDEVDLEFEEEVEIEDNVAVTVKQKTGKKFVLNEDAVEVSTDFPLTIDLSTNELIVTTPAGQKRVTVLPSVAIANMLRSGKFSGINAPEATASPTPTGSPEGTPSASESPLPTASGEASPTPSVSPSPEPVIEGVELTLNDNNELVYEINGYKNKNFLGLFKIKVNKKAIVSAETGELLDTEQSLASQILDLLSTE